MDEEGLVSCLEVHVSACKYDSYHDIGRYPFLTVASNSDFGLIAEVWLSLGVSLGVDHESPELELFVLVSQVSRGCQVHIAFFTIKVVHLAIARYFLSQFLL